MIVARLNTDLGRFFALSIAIHILVLSAIYSKPPVTFQNQQNIPVSILPVPPAREENPAQSEGVTKSAPTSPSRVPTSVAKKASPAPAEKSAAMKGKSAASGNFREEPNAPPRPQTPAKETIPERTMLAERQLPTLKELLPPANWSSGGARSSAPVSLNSRDPLHVTYFTKIKLSIEQHWEYPESALRYGLQGRLSLEFTIGSAGQLEQLRIVRSSGSQLLDDEAVRAITAAAPFPPIPSWVKPNPLSISASMEYHDNRLNYHFAR